MRYIHYISLGWLCFTALFLMSCYEDKGNYDYTELSEVSISFPTTDYTRAIGTTLSVVPQVQTDITENDLQYLWEVGCGSSVTGGRPEFRLLQKGRELSYDCRITELMPAPGTYVLRLHVIQTSSQRDFYSKPLNLTLSGLTGMMVLHDTDAKSDIGIITANEFRPVTQGEEVETHIFANYFSEANGGNKIDGIGRLLLQLRGGSAAYHNYHSVVAVTDRTNVAAGYGGLTIQKGGWSDLLFYGNLNRNQPQGIFFYGSRDPMYTYQSVYIFDGGELFCRQNAEYVIRPSLGGERAYMSGYDLAPYIIKPSSSKLGGVQVYLFDNLSKQFLISTNEWGVLMSSTPNEKYLARLNVPAAHINPAEFNADLLYWGIGGLNNHSLAVMRRADGSCFLFEMDMTTGSDFSLIPVATYEMDQLTDIDNVSHYAFIEEGNTIYACFYATPNGVYRFTVDGQGTALEAEPLKFLGGSELDFAGEQVTMLKIINHQDRDMMLIATYNKSTAMGTLHTMTIDPVNGSVTGEVKSYGGFGHITEVCLKHL